MAISIDNNSSFGNDVLSVRGKYGDASLKFSSTDHIDVMGAKSKYKLTFSQETARNTFYNNLINDPYIFFDYNVSIENVDSSVNQGQELEDGLSSRGLMFYVIYIEAKQEGGQFDIDFTNFPTGSYTHTQLVAGSATQFKQDYQLSITALNEENNVLFSKLYPYISRDDNTANWDINIAENLAPIVYTDKPNISTSTLVSASEATRIINIKYGEAYIDELVNNGRLYFYPTLNQIVEIGNFKPQVNTIGNGYLLGNTFDFLTIWDRSKYYPISCDGTHFLYFYLNSDAAHLEIKTIVYFNDGTSNTFSQNLTDIEKGIHYLPAGSNNHPNLSNISNIKNYSIQIIVGNSDPADSTSEIFNFKIQDSKSGYEILFLNKLGAFDRIAFDDIENEDLKLTPTRYLSTPSTHQTDIGGVATSNIESQTRFTAIYQGGFYTSALITWLKDFLSSEEKYLLLNGNLYRIAGEKQEQPIQRLDNKVILEFPFTTNHPI